MTALDLLKALGVAAAVIAITMAASFPMVAVYAYLIEPGHSDEFYTAAAQWIAPWSSHILGPLVFLVLNYLMARRSRRRNAVLFALATLVMYIIVDLSLLAAMGVSIATALTFSTMLSFLGKAAGAFAGAYLGIRKLQADRDSV
ncbi:MAG: hypothetical protein RIC89_14890 [Pseudomonadales bacterium]